MNDEYHGYANAVSAITLRERFGSFRVFFNGHDITNICSSANDLEGWAIIYKKKYGKQPYMKYYDAECILAKARIRGKIEYKFGGEQNG